MNMMVLLVAASLVGTSIIYKPAAVGAQPLQPPILPPQNQLPKQPPLKPQQPGQPSQLQNQRGQIVGQQISPPQQQQPPISAEQIKQQQKQDMELLDRIFPYIIQRIDGKTLAQKMDPSTLAAKVLPYLDITATINERSGRVASSSAGRPLVGELSVDIDSDVRCNSNERAVGGGYRYSGEVGDSMVYVSSPNGQNGWKTNAVLVSQEGSVQAYVTCLSLNVGIKNVQQPQQQQPSQPPGGSPLQPPPNLR